MESYIGCNPLGTVTGVRRGGAVVDVIGELNNRDRKSTRLNSSHRR